MHFTKLFAAAAAFAVASAQTYRFTNSNFTGITAGQPFVITWEPATDPVDILLKSGPSTAQTKVATIVSGATGGSFSWIPPATTVPGQYYNLEIDHGSDAPNYSLQFVIAGGTGSASSSVVSGSTTTTVTSSGSASSSTGSSTGSATTSASRTGSTTTSAASSTKASSTTSAVPTSNSAAQAASPFAFGLMSLFAMVVLN